MISWGKFAYFSLFQCLSRGADQQIPKSEPFLQSMIRNIVNYSLGCRVRK